jgi:hypothetical protein
VISFLCFNVGGKKPHMHDYLFFFLFSPDLPVGRQVYASILFVFMTNSISTALDVTKRYCEQQENGQPICLKVSLLKIN